MIFVLCSSGGDCGSGWYVDYVFDVVCSGLCDEGNDIVVCFWSCCLNEYWLYFDKLYEFVFVSCQDLEDWCECYVDVIDCVCYEMILLYQ